MAKQEEENYFEQGQRAARGYYKSQAMAGLTRYIKPEEAIKLFWPNAEETLMMVSTPMPKPRQKWISGFRKEQMVILAERQVTCASCGAKLTEPEKSND